MKTWLMLVLVGGLVAWPGAAAADPPPTCAGLPATIVGTDGDDVLAGTDGPDVVSLGDGNDRFEAGDGDDVVCGGAGIDDLYGQLGDDRLEGGDGDDSLWDDTAGGAVVDGDGEDALLGGPGDDDLWLSAGDGVGDGAAADTADGGEGTDGVGYLASPVGVRIDVVAGTGSGPAGGVVDTFAAVEGPYRGSGHGDRIEGGPGSDVLDAGRAETGRDRVYGHEGDDVLLADTGLVDAGPGRDRYLAANETHRDVDVWLGAGGDVAVLDDGRGVLVRGGPGPDRFLVRVPHDSAGLRGRLAGGPGEDSLRFSLVDGPVRVDLADRSASYEGSRLVVRYFDEVIGSPYDDVLLGGPEGDRLVGGSGDDVLRGRGGRDEAIGGPGDDDCRAERRVSC